MRMLVVIYIVVMNAYGCWMMRHDKRRAQQRKRRISEKRLWTVAFIGGAPGMAVGMNRYRHKTKHKPFRYGLPLLAFLDLAIYVYLYTLLS